MYKYGKKIPAGTFHKYIGNNINAKVIATCLLNSRYFFFCINKKCHSPKEAQPSAEIIKLNRFNEMIPKICAPYSAPSIREIKAAIVPAPLAIRPPIKIEKAVVLSRSVFLNPITNQLVNINMFVTTSYYTMTLREYTLNQMNISGITMGAMSKYGLGSTFLAQCSENGKNLDLVFGVQSSKNENKHVDLRGNPQPFLKREYMVRLTFTGINKILPNDWKQQGTQKGAQYLSQVFKNCDVKVACDCPAFYWQGMHEGDDKAKTSYFDFIGTKGTGLWNNRHAASGGVNIGQQMCKHIYNVAYSISNYIPEIAKNLATT